MAAAVAVEIVQIADLATSKRDPSARETVSDADDARPGLMSWIFICFVSTTHPVSLMAV